MVHKFSKKEIARMDIDNFIIFYTSDDKEREQMRAVLKDYMREGY
jgi:hypothetical protein